MGKGKVYYRDKRSPVPKSETVSRVMSAIKGKNTNPEITLRQELWKNNLKGYRIHYKKVPGSPDIAFVKHKLAIFINGCFWHRCPHCDFSLPKHNTDYWMTKFNKTKERDSRKRNELERLGWSVITIWECEMKEDISKVLLDIKTKLKSP